MLAAMADPDRAFDVVVIGSSECAFYDNQFAAMAPLFDHYGVGDVGARAGRRDGSAPTVPGGLPQPCSACSAACAVGPM
jgi:hypothetical protein